MTTQHIGHNRGARGGLHLWVALLLALLLLVSWLMGYGPGGSKCAPAADANLGRAAAVQSAAPPAESAVAVAPKLTAAPSAAPTPTETPSATASADAVLATPPVAPGTVAEPAAATSSNAAAPVQTASAAASPSAVPASPTSPAVATTPAPSPSPSPATATATATAPVKAPEQSPAPKAVVSALPVAKIYFAVEKASLPKTSGRTLARVVKYLKANPQAMASVSGFHDASGNLANNENLALRRAQAVASSMQKMGIAKQRIVLQKQEQTVGSGNSAEARRVEVGVAGP